MIKAKHFTAQELVPPKTFLKLGAESFNVIKDNTIITADAIREHFNATMIINTWHMNAEARAHYGSFEFRGYRYPGCGVGVVSGAHYSGQAIDFDLWEGVRKIPAAKIRQEILDNRAKFPAIKGIESGVEWCHFDTMIRPGGAGGKICLFGADNSYRWV